MKLPKTYEPGQYEADIYALWEKSEVFRPSGKGKPYSIVLPPPNANGNLHLGHALTVALEDIAIRYHRLRGDNTLYLPGADHAGFETQVVFERQLEKEGKSRFDFSREELYRQIWDFVAQNRGNFEQQFRRLGASFDWQHYTFTLDEKIVRQAYATFKKMWDEGLIYRGERIVNFCTFHGTAFADIEVEYKEEKGHLWYLRYPLTDGSGEIVVATTRPETMLGDTAVAVNPKDTRYQHFIGKTIRLPLTNREIPVIADEFVDENFGTGAVKVTPAHDPNDFEAGKRHDLPMMTVIDHEGKMMADVPEPYRGLPVDEARKQVLAALAEQGCIAKTEDYSHNVGHCYKCGTVIQPLLREQWFIDMDTLTKPAIEVLKAKKIAFYPERKRTQLITYLENLKDWNISRQIAWGIPIPAFQNINNPDDWIYDEHVDQELIVVDGKTYHRDPDVFDTWFSSSSWPYATLGYPEGKDFHEFYPLSLMETGFDILYPWVSRMLMFGLYTTGEIPFTSVYLHGLILDEHGQKMSKSKGNVINPMELVDQYGADALRMGIITGMSAGNNQPFGQPKVIGARNFCNKLWNIARFIESSADKTAGEPAKPESAADHWILQKLQQLQQGLEADLERYRFAEAYEKIYHFVWDDLADWYIEASKSTPNTHLLMRLLEMVLIFMHPFAPFLTETIWQTLDWTGESVLAAQQWPSLPSFDEKKAQIFADVQTIVSEARYITKTLSVPDATLYYTDVPFLADNANLIKRLAHLSNVTEVRDGNGLFLTTTPYRCWLDIDQPTAARFMQELATRRTEQEATVKRLEDRLTNKDYLHKAPKHVVDETRARLEEAKSQLEATTKEYERFKPIQASESTK